MAQKRINEITPNEEQKKCIDYQAGDLLVNGFPGAGKSVVLMQRAWKMYSEASPSERNVVLLTTYTTKLIENTKELFSRQRIDPMKMTIATMDSFCWNIYRTMFGSVSINKNKNKAEFVENARRNYLIKHPEDKNHRYFAIDEKFFEEEIQWMKERNVKSFEHYNEMDRVGRGGAVAVRRGHEREIIYGIFNEYQSILRLKHLIDWEDIYTKLLEPSVNLDRYKFTYVMIDEAQDFTFSKLAVAKKLTKKDITIAADKAQKIYNTGFTWQELGIDVRGNASKTLNKTFRSTKQIIQLAESLADVNRALEKDKGEYTDPILPTRIGADYPTVINCKNAAEEMGMLVGLVRELLKEDGTIGLIYRDYTIGNTLSSLLRANHIAFQDLGDKTSPWSLSTPGVKLVTMHSSKGLEFDTVIIPYFTNSYYPLATVLEKTDEDQKQETLIQERNLVYVGMTRAKANLFFTYTGSPSQFLKDFDPKYYNYCTPQGAELEKPKEIVKEEEPEVAEEEEKIDPSKIQKTDGLKAHVQGRLKSINLLATTSPAFIGKGKGDRVVVNGTTYVVDSIIKNRTSSMTATVKPRVKKRATWEDQLKEVPSADSDYINSLITLGAPVATTVNASLIGPSGDETAFALLAWEFEKVVYLTKEQNKYSSIWDEAEYTVIDSTMEPDKEWFGLK